MDSFDKAIEEYNVMENPFSSRVKSKPNMLQGVITKFRWKRDTRAKIMELLLGRFEWSGLPDNMPEYYMERKLIMNGTALIYDTPTDGMFVGTGTLSSAINHYEQPMKYSVVSPVAEHSKTYDLDVDGVLVKNDSLGSSDMPLLETYLEMLVDIRVTQTTNLNTMKTPFILSANEKTYNSVMEQYQQLTNGAPYMVIDPKLDKTVGKDKSVLEVFNTPTPYNLDKLQMLYNDINNEMLTTLGVNNNPAAGKKERVIVDEANANNDEIQASMETRLKLRQNAAKKANELFGTNITVKLSESFRPAEEQNEKIGSNPEDSIEEEEQ